MRRSCYSNARLATKRRCLLSQDNRKGDPKGLWTFRVFVNGRNCSFRPPSCGGHTVTVQVSYQEIFMIAHFGFGVLFITFLVTLYSVFAAIYGERKKIPAMVESARRAMLLT